jgi:glycine/D-amino acid oxidase-like deaminating enzyme
MNENAVWETVAMRIEGLQELLTLVDPNRIDYQATGSWDLLLNDEKPLPDSFLEYLNENIFKINGIRNTFSKDKVIIKSSGFEGIGTAYYNQLEGAIHTGKLITELHRLCVMDGIQFLFGIDVLSFESFSEHVEIQSNHGSLKSTNLLVCTNAFAQDYLPDISPARAQVLITKPIKNLNIQGTFHMNAGYYYFRNIGDRLLFGGGRHLDIQGETSTEFESSEIIQSELRRILSANLLPKSPFEIDYTWSGIMGVGTEKKPIIQKTNKNTAFGVRMGGMGVAIGASVGKKLSNLFL